MDTCVRSAITKGLRARGVDVLTAQEDGNAETPESLIDACLDRMGAIAVSDDTRGALARAASADAGASDADRAARALRLIASTHEFQRA